MPELRVKIPQSLLDQLRLICRQTRHTTFKDYILEVLKREVERG